MKVALSWQSKMKFAATARGNVTQIDARSPIGSDSAHSPKELMLSALVGCTAIDVVGLLKTRRQDLQEFLIDVEAQSSEGGHPRVFTSAKLSFRMAGTLDPKVALDAVADSQTRYCGVSAMLSRAFPIHYEVFVNGILAGSGQADFSPKPGGS
jgi:putative redox protein